MSFFESDGVLILHARQIDPFAVADRAAVYHQAPRRNRRQLSITRSCTRAVRQQYRIAWLSHRARNRDSSSKPSRPSLPRFRGDSEDEHHSAATCGPVFESAQPDLRALQIQQNARVLLNSRSPAHALPSSAARGPLGCRAKQFSRNTSTPASNNFANTSSESVEGPSVATIFVARIRYWSGYATIEGSRLLGASFRQLLLCRFTKQLFLQLFKD